MAIKKALNVQQDFRALSAYVKICLFFRQMAACVLEYFVDLQKKLHFSVMFILQFRR